MSATPVRPQVVAHRGASHREAEHTLAAYLAAIEEGAEALECDVRLTADGHLVCVHDADLRRVGGGDQRRVSTMDLAELADLDVATWKRPWQDLDDEAGDNLAELGRVLTLRKLLETVAAQDRRIELAIETKHPNRYGGLVERRLIELLADFGWSGPDSPARVMSFSYTALQRVRRQAPDLRVVMLFDKAERWPLLRRALGPGWLIGPGISELRESGALRERLRRSQREIHVWTVNSEEDFELCVDLGVRAVITDRPGLIRKLADAL